MTRERIVYSNTDSTVSRTIYIDHLPRDYESLVARLRELASKYEFVALAANATSRLYLAIDAAYLRGSAHTFERRVVFDLANMVESAQIARVVRKLES